MERNRWETAIRCLEMALHPNTADDEVVAAVHAFRRIGGGRPLHDICAAGIGLADATLDAPLPVAQGERLHRENHELRRRLADAEAAQDAATDRLHQARQRLGESRAELRVARDEAAARARQIAEIRDTQAAVLERLQRENADLRQALDAARPGAGAAAPQFRTLLAASLEHAGIHVPEPAGLTGTSGRLAGDAAGARPGWFA